MVRYAWLTAAILLLTVGGQAAALTAVAEVNEDPYYTTNRAAYYGNTSLTNFYAPLPVFFEGWKSSPRTEIASYSWNFGDGSPLMSGFNAAHVYETPGTYTATLTVKDAAGATATATRSITVRARDGAIYYVDAVSGNDNNTGTTQAQAWKTATKAFQGLSQAQARYNPGDQILFRRGQTFDFTGYVAIDHNKKYGYVFGAFGTGNRPIIQYKGGAGAESMFSQKGRGLAHVSFVDLDFRCTTPDGSHTPGFWYSTGDLNQTLFLRCSLQDFNGGFIFSHGKEEKRCSGAFIVECTTRNSQFHHLFGEIARLALLRNSFDLSGNHIAYISYLDKGVIQGNQFTRHPGGRTSLRVAGSGGFTNPSNNIWVEDNYFSGWVDPIVGGAEHGDGVRYNGIVVHFGPNTAIQQAMNDLVFQNNTVVDGEKLVAVSCYENVIVRNNLLWTHSPWTEGHIYFSSHQNFDQRPLKNIQVYENFIVKNSAPSNASARLVEIRPYTGPAYPGRTNHEDLVFRNNTAAVQGGRVIWFENTDNALMNQLTSNNNRVYTPAPTLLAGRATTNYDLAGWRSLSGEDANSNVFGHNVLPGTGTASAPATVNSGAISVSYSGATDPSGSGVKRVHLWVRKDLGSWIKTPLTSTGASGTISFTPTKGNGTYYFWVQTENNAGHFSLPKTVTPQWPNMSSKRTLSPHGDTQTAYGGGVQGETPPPPPPPPPTPDTTAPTVGTLTAPSTTQASPITVNYSGASDNTGGSGLQKVMLHMKKGTGSWTNTGLESAGASGSFAFIPSGAATYYFALVAVDVAGNQSAAPSGNGQASSVYTVPPPPAGGLVSYLKFDDDPADGAIDSARPGVNATVGSGVKLAAGHMDGAYDFDNGSVSLGNLDVSGTGLTLAAWVNADWYPSSANDPRIISKSTNVNEQDDRWMLSTVNSGGQIRLRFRLKTQGGTTSTLIGGSGDLPALTWSHVAATFDGSNMRVYVNGVLNGTLAKSGTVVQDPAVPLVIGNQAAVLNRRWDGRIDEVRIYDRALSAAEILGIMSGGVEEPPLPPPPPVVPPTGTVTAPGYAKSLPFSVSYTATGANPIQSVKLLYRRQQDQLWSDSGLTSAAASGQFNFNSATTSTTYYFALAITDNKGTVSVAPAAGSTGLASTIYDAAAPSTGSLSGPASKASGSAVISYSGITDTGGSGVDTITLWRQAPGGSWGSTGMTSTAAPSGSFTFNSFTADGAWRFAVQVQDKAGNLTGAPSGTGQLTIQQDTTAPSVPSMSVTPFVKAAPITVSYSGATDSGSGLSQVELWVKIGTGAWSNTGLTATAASGQFSYSSVGSDGVYRFSARVRDVAGNQSATPSGDGLAQTTLDRAAPQAATASSPQYRTATPIAVAYSNAADSGSGLASARLWVRKGTGAWQDTGITATTASGTLNYSAVSGDATYYFQVQVEDKAGNRSATPSGTGPAATIYDTTAPTTGTLTAAKTVVTTGPIAVSYSGVTDAGSGLDQVEFFVRKGTGAWASTGQTAQTATGSFNYTTTGDASYQFALRTRDKAGNQSAAPSGSGQLTVQLDSSAPTVGALTVAQFTTTSPVAVQYATVTDASGGSGLKSVELHVRKDSGAWTATGQTSTAASGSFSYPVTTGDGVYRFAVRAEDNAGNKSAAPSGDGAAQTTHDTTRPVPGAASAPAFSSTSPITVQFSGASDGGSGLQNVTLWTRRDGGAWTAAQGHTSTAASGSFAFAPPQAGTYDFALRARDKAGNESLEPVAVDSTTVFDNEPPVLGALQVAAQGDVSPISIGYSGVTDAGSGVESVTLWAKQGSGGTWASTGQVSSNGEGSFSYGGFTVNGAYFFSIVAVDKAGNSTPTPTGSGMASTNFNSDFTPGTAQAPEFASTLPIVVSYSGAQDKGGQGALTIRLWFKQGDNGVWVNTGLTATGESGSFEFEGATTDGPYHFAIQARNTAGELSAEPFGNGNATTIYDTTPPTALAWASPLETNTLPIEIDYSGVYDAGSGVKRVMLWVRRGEGGQWTNTGMTAEGDRGVFLYNEAPSDDQYYFYIQAEDKAGLVSPTPTQAKEAILAPTGPEVVLILAPVTVNTALPLESTVTILPPGGIYQLVVIASGGSLDGEWPALELSIDGVPQGVRQTVTSSEANEYSYPTELAPGVYSIGAVLANPVTSDGNGLSVTIQSMGLQPLGGSTPPVSGAQAGIE